MLQPQEFGTCYRELLALQNRPRLVGNERATTYCSPTRFIRKPVLMYTTSKYGKFVYDLSLEVVALTRLN